MAMIQIRIHSLVPVASLYGWPSCCFDLHRCHIAETAAPCSCSRSGSCQRAIPAYRKHDWDLVSGASSQPAPRSLARPHLTIPYQTLQLYPSLELYATPSAARSFVCPSIRLYNVYFIPFFSVYTALGLLLDHVYVHAIGSVRVVCQRRCAA